MSALMEAVNKQYADFLLMCESDYYDIDLPLMLRKYLSDCLTACFVAGRIAGMEEAKSILTITEEEK